MTTYHLTIPQAFFDDTFTSGALLDYTGDDYRELISTAKRGKRYDVKLTARDLRELAERADYYADSDIARDMGMPGLRRSAAATLDAIKTQHPNLAS